MLCRLCLLETNKSVLIFSEEKIQKHITKFLQLKVTPEDPISNVICSICLNQLENFTNFYFRVEEAQKGLSSAQENVKKEEVLHVSNVAVNVDVVPFIRIDTDSNFNELKEEGSIRDSDDESHANSDLLPILYEHDVAIKVEETTGELAAASNVPESGEPAITRRITRGSVVNKQTTAENTLAEGILKRKRGRPKKEANVEEPAADTEACIEDTEDKHNHCPPEQNEKRRRGRPKKGEERPKVKKIRSAKCERILETAKEFDEIIQKHMNLVCNICCVSLIDFAELKRHFRAVHNRKGYAVCCNKRLYKRGLVVDHINTHNNPEYFKCKECGKVMADRMCLRNHMLLMHQNEEEKMFQCSYCPKKYAKQYLLDHHSVKHIPKEECTFFCAECDRGFPTKTTLTKHLNQIHSTVYDKMCEICAKLIRGNAAFERHMDEHEGIVRPQVQCKICGSWLKDKNSLRKHMYKHDGKSYTCNECGKVAPSKSALQSHLRYVHQTLRQFHCTFCDKSFKKAVNLREHLTTHTGEILYTCPHCPKTFNSKANMHAHRKKKHREEWEANRRYNVKQAPVTETNIELESVN